MKKLYPLFFIGTLACAFLIISPSSIFGQITSEFDNGNASDSDNDDPDDAEVVSFSLPGGVTGEFQSGNDNDFFSITLATDTDFELVIINPEAGFTQTAPGYSVEIFAFTDVGRTNQSGTEVEYFHGQEFTLTGTSLFYSVNISKTAGGGSPSTYTLALAAGNGTGGDAVFPVDWLSFETQASDAGVKLLWSTASEENNKGFEVERSADAQNWEYLGFVEGAGSTTEIQEYDFVDAQPEMGFNYYRLKQIDFNGDFEYSDIREIALGVEAFSNTPPVYPNPIQSQLTIGPFLGQALISDISGRVVFQKRLEGNWHEENLEQLPAGTYFLRLQPLSGGAKYFVLSKN